MKALMLYDNVYLKRHNFYRLKLQISNILCQIACRIKILVIQIMKLLWLHLNSPMVSLTVKGFHMYYFSQPIFSGNILDRYIFYII